MGYKINFLFCHKFRANKLNWNQFCCKSVFLKGINCLSVRGLPTETTPLLSSSTLLTEPNESLPMDELQDWEVLHDSDDCSMVNSSDSVEKLRALEEMEGDSEVMIRVDYFSIDSQKNYARTVDVSVGGSVESDNPSWIDPGSETRYPRKESGEFWSASGSDRSDDRKFVELEAKSELGLAENGKALLGFRGIGEIGAENENTKKFWSDSSGIGPFSIEFEGFKDNKEFCAGDDTNSRDGSESSDEEKEVEGSAEGCDELAENRNTAREAMKSGGVAEKRTVVWWKVPFEFVKYCAFRVSPVWTVSVAAAVLGFIILGRRLYKIKRKTSNLELRVTVDDKKVSQFMAHASRLNEAFSVVKRVPVIRTALPAAGVTPWPVVV